MIAPKIQSKLDSPAFIIDIVRMRLRDAQSLIFGSLSLMLLLFAGSIWTLSRLFARENPVEIPPPQVADLEQQWQADLPSDAIWADAGTTATIREIENYALAGTFQTYEGEADPNGDLKTSQSLALVDDLKSGRQYLLKTDDPLGSFEVANIGMDQVTLRRGTQLYVLALSGEVAQASAQPEAAPAEEAPLRLEDMPALETSRFGKRVSDNQWVIDRQAVFDYADEVMNNPYRMVQFYRSFSQVGGIDDERVGFEIDIKGEKDFFRDMGLGDGDVIRKANSMDMRTQLRAEYLLREFMHSRMSAVVLDVENNGEMRKQIFIIR